ncbi:MAG: cysteine--tRNA ligase [SAR202 cluster bacterium]|nr:cysteine--tRNA ligase [SAR202 cluster bacterium]
MLELYNTLTKRQEEVRPVEPGAVGIYTCGPTVYRDAHIGNLRSYLMADWIRRALEVQGLAVTHVKNITDVGHMRQEVLEQGEDKIIAAAIAEGKTPAEIAQFYTERFLKDERSLNIASAHHLPKATDHIQEMLEIVERLVEKGYAYEVQGNVYFEVSRFPDYGKLSGNIQDAELLEAVRIEADPLKRDPRDFTLWKTAEPGRTLKWPSPWGDGFPGWHIECSAMSIKYLGRRFDIHTGGVDNIFPHHEGEIAQSEGFAGDRVVNTWVHGQHLLADGVKMAKSAGNSFILTDIESQGIDPMAFRYLCLTARYKTRLNFTFSSLKAAQRAWLRLRNRVWEWDSLPAASPGNGAVIEEWQDRFLEKVNSDLDLPRSLALTWEMVKSDLPAQLKLEILRRFDRVLGLGLDGVADDYRLPEGIQDQLRNRHECRRRRAYDEADAIRESLGRQGYLVEDTAAGTRARPKTLWEKRLDEWSSVSSAAEVPSRIEEPDKQEFTVGIVACNYLDDVKRCIRSTLRWVGKRRVEVLVVDNGSADGTSEWLEETAAAESKVRVVHTDHVLGEGAAKTILLKQTSGGIIVLLDTSVELTGDIFTQVEELLADHTIGVAGPFGLKTDTLHHFHEGEGEDEAGDMDAMQAYLFAFRRRLVKEVGPMRESFRFYRNLDLDYSFQFKDKGYRIVARPDMPVERHLHRVWSELPERERDELSKRNYRRFLDRWGDRDDLLVSNQRKG